MENQSISRASGVYWSLPVADREKAVIFGANYGDASAIQFGFHLCRKHRFVPVYTFPMCDFPRERKVVLSDR
jgi:hypothetical protein